MLPARLGQPLLLVKGATFRQSFLLQQPVFQFRPVSTSKATAPVQLVVPAHGLQTGQPIWIENVTQFTALNRPRPGQPIYAEVIDEDTLRIPVNGVGQLRAKGGQIVFQTPVDLTDCSARLELVLPQEPEPEPDPCAPPPAPEPAPDPEAPVEPVDPVEPPPTSFLASIDPLLGKVSILIPATITSEVTWSRAKFRLWLTMSNGDVDPWVTGEIVAREAL